MLEKETRAGIPILANSPVSLNSVMPASSAAPIAVFTSSAVIRVISTVPDTGDALFPPPSEHPASASTAADTANAANAAVKNPFIIILHSF